MRIRMKQTVGSFQTGDVYDLQGDFARQLVKESKAELTDSDRADVPNKSMKKGQVKTR